MLNVDIRPCRFAALLQQLEGKCMPHPYCESYQTKSVWFCQCYSQVANVIQLSQHFTLEVIPGLGQRK